MAPSVTRQPDFLQTDARVLWCWGNGNDVWGTFEAAMSGDVGRLESLIKKDPDLIRCECGYRTPFHFAVRENQLEAVKWLLNRGADVANTYQGWHDRPVQISRDRGNHEMASLIESFLIERWGICSGGDEIGEAFRERDVKLTQQLIEKHGVSVADERGNQPLHWAVMTRQIEFVDSLLAAGADINVQRPDGARPLDLTNGDYWYRGWRRHADAVDDHWKMMDHLLSKGAIYDLTSACRRNDFERVKTIVAEDSDAAQRDAEYNTWYSGYPLRSASKAGHLEIVRFLLEHGADPNRPEHWLAPLGGSLYDAAQNGHFEVLTLLLQFGGNPNQEVESSGSVLSAANDQRTRDLLREHGAIQDAFGCCFNGHAEDFAKRCKQDPFEANHTELFAMAAERGFKKIVDTFLKYQPDMWQRAPVYLSQSAEMMKWLESNDIHVNNVSWLGVHQLHHGCDEAALKKWIELGVDLNLIDSEHQSTPLGWAARRGDVDFAKMLLECGADPNLAGEPWATPLEWSKRRGHSALVALLKSNGAN